MWQRQARHDRRCGVTEVLCDDDDCTANEDFLAIDLVFADHVTDAPTDAHVR